MTLSHIRHEMAVRISFIAFILMVAAAFIRPDVESLPFFLTYIAIGDALLAGLVYLFISYSPAKPWHAYLVLGLLCVLSIPPIYLTGGVNSYVAVAIPLIPIVSMLMCGAITAWCTCVMMLMVLGGMWSFADHLPNYGLVSPEATGNVIYLKWLGFVTILGTVISHQFERLIRQSEQSLDTTPDAGSQIAGVLPRHAMEPKVHDAVAQAQINQRWLSVFVIEVDTLQNCETLHGDEFRNECLQQVAHLLSRSVRSQRDAVGYCEESRFLVLMDGVDQSNAHKIGDKIRTGIGAIEHQGKVLGLTATIGYCSMPGEEIHTDEQIVGAARQALCVGVSQGRDQTVGAEQAIVTDDQLTVVS